MNRTLGAAIATLAVAIAPVSAQTLFLTSATGPTGEASWALRIGARLDLRSIADTSGSGGRLTGYLDGGYTWWLGRRYPDNHSLSLAPVALYEFAGARVRPYIEGGVGLGVLVRTRVEAHELGSTVNFEDRIGIGVRFGAQELGLQAIHYSNAGLRMPNQGAETFTLHYSVVL